VKKRFLSVICAMVMVLAMGISAFAAVSPDAGNTGSGNGSTSAPAVVPSKPAEVVVPAEKLAIGTQQLTVETINEYAETTTVTSDVEATITAVSAKTAANAITVAKTVINDNAYIATVVDLSVPAGTGAASFTLACPVLKGQKVTILHQKSDGIWEAITPSNVANGSVTFTLTSYSPVAVVVDTTAPKTGE